MKLRSKDGIEMMGTMAATILVSPEDLWGAYRLLSPATVMRLPVLLAKGWARSRRKP